jgi:hypothetical protein
MISSIVSAARHTLRQSCCLQSPTSLRNLCFVHARTRHEHSSFSLVFAARPQVFPASFSVRRLGWRGGDTRDEMDGCVRGGWLLGPGLVWRVECGCGGLAVNQCGRWGWVPGKQTGRAAAHGVGEAAGPRQIASTAPLFGGGIDLRFRFDSRARKRATASGGSRGLACVVPGASGSTRPRVPSVLAAIDAWSARRRERTVRN